MLSLLCVYSFLPLTLISGLDYLVSISLHIFSYLSYIFLMFVFQFELIHMKMYFFQLHLDLTII